MNNSEALVELLNQANKLKIKIPIEMFHFIKVMIYGAKKYEPNNWMDVKGVKSSHKEMHASIFRHVAESSAGVRADHETELDPLLHAACRCMMMYYRIQKGMDE